MTLYLSSLARARRELLENVVQSALDAVSSVCRLEDVELQEVKRIRADFERHEANELSKRDCEICLGAIHRAMYTLGPFELHTLTGHTLREYASVGLIFASVVYGGIYTGLLWTEGNHP